MKKIMLAVILLTAVGLSMAAVAVESRLEITNVTLSLLAGNVNTITGSDSDIIAVNISFKNNAASERIFRLDAYPSDAAGNRDIRRIRAATISGILYSNIYGREERTHTHWVSFAHGPDNTYYVTVKLESQEPGQGWSTPILRTASITDSALHAPPTIYTNADIGRIPIIRRVPIRLTPPPR